MTTHFASIKAAHNVSERSIWRSVKVADPKLGKHVLIEYRPPLKSEVKEERVRASELWMRRFTKQPAPPSPSTDDTPPPPVAIPRTPEDLNTAKLEIFIWVDAKKFYIKPKAHKVWGTRGSDSIVVQDSRARGAWVVHYYSAVNYKLGAVLIVLVSGTHGKGYKPAKTYAPKGRKCKARGPTAAEFKDFIKACLKVWNDEFCETLPPIFSWDNTRIHGNYRDEADGWGSLGIDTETHMQLPPYSPDMHSVIELSHARLMHEMQQFINNREGGPGDSLEPYTESLGELFQATITPEWAKATTHWLFIDVLPAILQANGDYPPKKYR
ncbi:hypothetical protein PLESTB_000942600 [Pleodorina starrii]|uniref:Uncharacterized protein n=1 Tax=Pleodorina starrii TaxID=330485 RepID=A0A9W6BMQ7_9CHLO|nr:hypothetical protein PLESTB_000942600 [Pleodorina starrii]